MAEGEGVGDEDVGEVEDEIAELTKSCTWHSYRIAQAHN